MTICVHLGHENATIKKQLWDIFYSKTLIELEGLVEKDCSNTLRKHAMNLSRKDGPMCACNRSSLPWPWKSGARILVSSPLSFSLSAIPLTSSDLQIPVPILEFSNPLVRLSLKTLCSAIWTGYFSFLCVLKVKLIVSGKQSEKERLFP